MSSSGLTCSSSRLSSSCIMSIRGPRFLVQQVPACSLFGVSKRKLILSFHMDRDSGIHSTHRMSFQLTHKTKSTMDARYGDTADDSSAIFPNINVKDPYKCLGICTEASEEEIQAARNFFINRYAGHKPSIDAIESAHNKIIMQKFHERRRPKINIKKRMREVSQSRVVQAVMSRFRTPSLNFIIKTATAFSVLGALTVLFPTEEGPTLQVLISLLATVGFIYARLKNWIRALLYGAGVFFGSWLLGTLLMVSVIPPLLKGPWSLEVTTSLITYLLQWFFSSYLR